MKFLSESRFQAVLSALLLSTAYDYPQTFWMLALVGLIPFLSAIGHLRSSSTKTVFRHGFLFGALFILLTNFWYIQAFPLDWANIYSPLYGSLLIIFFLGLATVILGTFIGLWTVIFTKLRSGGLEDIILASSLWILCEHVRAFMFSIITIGPNGTAGTDWTFSFIGYTLAWSPLLPYASVGGVYLLGFIAVSINLILFLAGKKSVSSFKPASPGKNFLLALRFLAPAASLIAAIFLIPILFASSATNHPTDQDRMLSIAAPHTVFHDRKQEGISDYRKYEIFQELIGQIRRDGKDPDVIVFPEESNFLNILSARKHDLRRYFSETLGEKERLIIDAGQMDINGKVGSAVFYYDTGTDTTILSKKRLPVINGEYLPWITRLPLEAFQAWDVLDHYPLEKDSPIRDVRIGTVGNISVGALVCSEAYSPNLLREPPFDQSAFIANPSSHTIFHGSSAIARQSVAMAKIRAAESGRFFVSAGNDAPSFVIDSSGNMVSFIDGDSPSLLYADIPIPRDTTAETTYVRFGPWPLLIFSVIAIGIMYRLTTRKKRLL